MWRELELKGMWSFNSGGESESLEERGYSENLGKCRENESLE